MSHKTNTPVLKGKDGDCGLMPMSPATPYRVIPDVTFEREVVMDIKNEYLINGEAHSVYLYGFTDPANGGEKSFPSPVIRVRQGQTVHTHLVASHIHTIHHHGIEPSTHNDGVGHYSFDVQGAYSYQWYASQSGTYFYHCHVNTVLHAEMGMYGALIIDPPSGPGTVEGDGIGNFLLYDVEAIWAVDELDSHWRKQGEHAALCGGDAGLNKLEPDIFVINGIANDNTVIQKGGVSVTVKADTAPGVAVNARVGDRILIRYIQAGYFPQKIRFPSGLGKVKVIAEDGRPLAQAEILPVENGFSVDLMTPAERKEFYLVPKTQGVYRVSMEIQHWITREVVGSVSTLITVN